MIRTRALILALTLAAPLPVAAQDASAPMRQSAPTGSGAEEAQIFVSALRAISQLSQKSLSDSTLWTNALDGLIESLNDPYASVFTPSEVDQFEEANTGNYAGIGVQITELDDLVTVTAVFRGTPAEQVGMQVGDIIVGVNGDDTRDWTTQQVSDVIRGPVGSEVKVAVERDGYERPIPLDITRDEVHVSAVADARLPDGLAYVAMDRVARNVAQELDSVLSIHRNDKGLILDLRGNPGGYLDEALMLSDIFLSPGQTLAATRSRTPGKADETTYESYTDRMPPRIPQMPIIVLVNDYTASAAEILTGALQDYDRALVVGQRTFGKGIVQTVLDLPYGRKLRLTTGSWYTPLGRSLHRPRGSDGMPLPEDVDTFPEIRTPAGRTLIAAGGIFPDLDIEDDTLKLKERELLQTAAEDGVPLPLRVAEFGFSEAKVLKEAGEAPHLRQQPFDAFLDQLVSEGLPSELVHDAVVVDYLNWRARLSIADRMDDLATAAEVRMERDPVLRTAQKLLEESRTQPELYAQAAQAGGEGRASRSEGSAR